MSRSRNTENHSDIENAPRHSGDRQHHARSNAHIPCVVSPRRANHTPSTTTSNGPGVLDLILQYKLVSRHGGRGPVEHAPC